MIVCVSGGFDPIHEGHIDLLKEAAEFGDLIVLLNSDSWLAQKKGKPFMTWEQRSAILNAYNFIELVLAFDDSDGLACDGLEQVQELFPEENIAFANGGDRLENNTPEVLFCKAHNISMLWGIGGEKVASSSEMLANHFNKLVKRKWGLWSVLKSYRHVKVKELVIYPGEEISYQKHNQRSEVWFIVSGNPWILINDHTSMSLKPFDTITIKQGDWHQIINKHEIEPVHIVEIQYGTRCTETDIERKDFP